MGLNGLVVKSHGSANAAGIASAIDLAVDVASADLIEKIAADLATMDGFGGTDKETENSSDNEAAVS